MIKFVGFKVNKGSFLPDGSTKEMSYNSRVLHFVTDDGLPDDFFGMQPISEKIKVDVLAQYYGIDPNADNVDALVNTKLGELLQRDILFDFGPVNGKIITVGIRPVK